MLQHDYLLEIIGRFVESVSDALTCMLRDGDMSRAGEVEDAIGELLEMDVLIQMNAGALLHRSSHHRAVTMVKNGITQILGTDSHNLDSRCPNMKDGIAVMRKDHLGRQADEILDNNAAIYRAAME